MSGAAIIGSAVGAALMGMCSIAEMQSTTYDAKGLLKSAIRDNNPV
jgi:pyruvate/2-oxoglutarate/acetoin dehydrogenase E1 component